MDAAPPPTLHTGTPPAAPSEGIKVQPSPAPLPELPAVPVVAFPELPPRPIVHPRSELLTAWPRSAQWAMVVLLLLATGLLSCHVLFTLRWGSRPTELDQGLGYRIDLNQADQAELLQLPGIGPSRVQRILQYRQAHGGFRSVDELRNVHGIGTATLETLRPWVCVGFEEADEENDLPAKVFRRPRAQVKRRANADDRGKARLKAVKKGGNLKEKIDLNRATAEQLRLLPKIGPKLAERIIAERRKKPFRTVEDLTRVRGIKEGILAQVRPFATVSRKPGDAAHPDD